MSCACFLPDIALSITAKSSAPLSSDHKIFCLSLKIFFFYCLCTKPRHTVAECLLLVLLCHLAQIYKVAHWLLFSRKNLPPQRCKAKEWFIVSWPISRKDSFILLLISLFERKRKKSFMCCAWYPFTKCVKCVACHTLHSERIDVSHVGAISLFPSSIYIQVDSGMKQEQWEILERATVLKYFISTIMKKHYITCTVYSAYGLCKAVCIFFSNINVSQQDISTINPFCEHQIWNNAFLKQSTVGNRNLTYNPAYKQKH